MPEELEKALRSPFDMDVPDISQAKPQTESSEEPWTEPWAESRIAPQPEQPEVIKHPDQQELPGVIQQHDVYNPPAYIDNTNKHFKGQHKNEFVHAFCRKHWIVLIPHFIGFAAFMVGITIFLVFISSGDLNSLIGPVAYKATVLVALIALTYYVHSFFNRIFNYYLRIYVITNFRVIDLDKSLYFTHNKDSIDIREIQDIVIQQNGFFQTVFNYGSIIITLSSAHATKTLTCIPNPEYHFRKINKTKREYITSRREHGQVKPLVN